MAIANCDRELSCENIGSGRRYENRDLCISTFEIQKFDELRLPRCLLGVDYVQLELCRREIKTADCSSPLYTLDALGACRSSKLCRD